MGLFVNNLMMTWWMKHHADVPPSEPYILKSAISAASTVSANNKHWIDTGLSGSIKDVWEITAMMTSSGNSKCPIGTGKAKDDGTNFAIWLHAESSPNYVEFVFGYGSNDSYRLKVNQTAGIVNSLNTFKMKLETGEAWINGNLVGQSSKVGAMTEKRKLVFFGCWRGSAINSDFWTNKIYRIKNHQRWSNC